jgi:hypothetical protein
VNGEIAKPSGLAITKRYKAVVCQHDVAALFTGEVLGNCQLGGRGDEGQPGLILVFAKAVLVHQCFQSAG